MLLRRAGRRRVVPLLAALAVVATPAVTRAQTVRGALVERHEGRPLPGAMVGLLDTSGTALDSMRTSADGEFVVRAPRPGEYFLYFTHAGYASVPSDRLRLGAGETLEYRFAVPLISGAALQRMSEVIDVEARLQSDLTALCGERPRPDEGGIVVGVVRQRRGEPLSGAIVRVTAPRKGDEPFEKATVSSANGVYVICNVPPGTVRLRTERVGFRTDDGPADVRAGEISWYDVYLTAR
jgi:hypothetical protein